MLIKGFKRQFWGYHPADVDNYLESLQQEHQRVQSAKKIDIANKKNRVLSEIAHAEQMLKTYRDEERQSFNLLAAELANAENIVRQAQEQSQRIKLEALKNLQAQEERLLYLQKLMQQVYDDLTDVRKNLQEVSDGQEDMNVAAASYSTGLRIIKGYESERKAIGNTCSAGVR